MSDVRDTRQAAGRATRLAPVTLLAGGVLANAFAPQPYLGLPFLACSPLLAGLVYSFRASVLVAVTACATATLTAVAMHRESTAVVTDAVSVLLVSVIGLWIKLIVDRQAHSLMLAREVAAAAQQAVLPAPPPEVGPLAASARYLAARAGTEVGGDFYALQETPYGVRAVIGDVRGKGLKAVAAVSVVVGAFREAAENAPSLSDLAARLDAALDREGTRRRGSVDEAEGFVTALFVQFTPDGRRAELLNRGHTAPYLIRPDDVSCLEPGTPGLPLSTGLGPSDEQPAADSITFERGDILLLVTDGVTEARNARGEFFDPCRVLHFSEEQVLEQLTDTVVEKVLQWTDGQRQDDIAILAISPLDGPDQDPGRCS